jgi:hypothetical protein
MAEKNSLWKNIRKKAEQNRRTGNKPKEPTKEMLDQERKIKAKQYYNGGPTGNDEDDKIIDPADYLISKVIMNRSKDQNLDQTTPINNNEDGAPYRPLSIPMEGYELPEREDYTPYKPLSIPMIGYEPDPSFYNTPSKTETTKASNKTKNKKPVNKPNNVKSNTGNSEISPYTRFLLDNYKYKNQNSQYTQPRYITERDASSTPLSPAISTSGKESTPSSYDTQAIQIALDLGQMVPNPYVSGAAYIASLPFTTMDVFDSLDKNDYKQAGIDALGYIPTFRVYRRGLKGNKYLDETSKLAKQYKKINNIVNTVNLSNDASKKANGGPVGDDDKNKLLKGENDTLLAPTLNTQVVEEQAPQWMKDKESLNPDEINFWESFNPKKWGLNDYSNYSSFNSAFRNAREAGEKEFVWNRNRYTTDLVPEEISNNYWDSKNWLENYYKNENFFPVDTSISALMDFSEKQFGNQFKYNNYNELSQEEKLNFENAQRQKYIDALNDPNYYFSITTQPNVDEGILASHFSDEDRKWIHVSNKGGNNPANDYTTFIHELSHKGDSKSRLEYYNQSNRIPKVDIDVLNKFGTRLSQKRFEYVNRPTETEARKMSTLYFMNKNLKKDISSGKIKNKDLTELYNIFNSEGGHGKSKSIPDDVQDLLELYKYQWNDLLKYLNNDFSYAQGGYVDGDDDKKKKTRVYTDPREFRIAQQNYNDSLAVANHSQILIDAYNRARGTNTGLSRTEYRRVNSDNPYPADAISRLNRPKPISKYNINITNSKRPDLDGIHIFKEPEVIPVFRKPEIELIPSKPYKGESTEPTIIPTPPNVDFGKPNLDNFFEGTYEKYRKSPYEDPMYRVWISGQQQQIVPESEFKKLSDQYLLKDLDAPDPGGNLYDKPKATGGYMYDGGGDVKVGDDGTPLAPTLKELEVIDEATGWARIWQDEYNKRLGAQKTFQESWYPGQEYDPTNIERRASIAADDAAAKYILDNHASRNDFANRQEYLKSFNPYEREVIARSNYAGNLDPDMGSRFRKGLGLLMGTRSALTNPDPDLSAEDYADTNFLSNIGDIFSPATYFLNLGKGAATGTFASALRGKPSNPWVDATDMPLGDEEDVWKYNVEGDIIMDPLNFAGTGIGSSLYDDLGKVGKFTAKSFNKIATGNSRLTDLGFPAWKVEKPSTGSIYSGLSRPYIARNVTDREAELLSKFGKGMRLSPEEWKEMEALVKSGATDFSKENIPISRIIGYYNRGNAENQIIENLKTGEVFTTPTTENIRTWSAGVPDVSGSEYLKGKTRLIIPSRYTKDLGSHFSAMPYDDLRIGFIHENPTTGMRPHFNFNAAKENELMGNIPEGFKVIGRSKEDGLNNLIIKPIKSKQTSSLIKNEDNLKYSTILNEINEIKSELSNAFKGSKSFFNEIKGELLQGKANKETIKKANEWLKNWIEHPATQKKIDTDIDNKIDYVTQFYKDPFLNEELEVLNLIKEQSKNFKPNSKEYSLLKQLDDNLQQYLIIKSRKSIHQNNLGVSYQHKYHPIHRQNIEKGIQEPYDRYGSFISRRTRMPQSKRMNVTIHEGGHDWVSEEAFKKSGMRNIALKNMNPDIKKDFLEWEYYNNMGIDPVKKMGKERAYQAYLADPTEQHARIMELRYQLDITPDYIMDEKKAKSVIDWIESGYSTVDSKFLNVIDRDPKKLAELFNKFWMAPPAIIGTGVVGAGVMQDSQPEQQSQGGYINPYMYYAGGPIDLEGNDKIYSTTQQNSSQSSINGRVKNYYNNFLNASTNINSNGNITNQYSRQTTDPNSTPVINYFNDSDLGSQLKIAGPNNNHAFIKPDPIMNNFLNNRTQYLSGAMSDLNYAEGGVLKDIGKLFINNIVSPFEHISGNNFYNPEYENKGFANTAAVMEGFAGLGTDIAGSIFLGPAYGMGKGAIQGVTKNLGHSQEYQRGADKWANKTGQIASSAGNLTSGIISGNPQQIIGGAGQVLGTLGSEFGSKKLNAAGQLVGMGSQFVNPSQGMPSTTPSVDSSINNFQSPVMYPDQMLNQGLSFAATGGPLNNKEYLVNSQIDSMRNRYKTYKTKYRQGGSMNQSNVDFISDKAGLHRENVYEGVHLTKGKGAYANGGAALVEAGEGVIRDKQGNPSFILPDQGNGEPVYMLQPNASYTDFERDKDGNYIELPITVADWRKKEEKRGSNFRDPENDYISNPRKDNANQLAMAATEIQKQLKAQRDMNNEMMVEGALQIAAAGGKLNKDLEKILSNDIQRYVEADNYYAYGGYLPKDKGFNMPNSYAKGGSIHIKKSKRGTFTAAAKKRGKSVQEFARQVLANKENYSSAMVKKANFARNAAGWKHAHGGPMVSNVAQPFQVAAQNRGGMMMANGGMMQQSSQQDQMMQMVQQVQEMLMQGANPQELLKQLMKSGLPQDQAQQLVQAAMQDLESQQQSQQTQMAMGGKMYANGGPPYDLPGMFDMTANPGTRTIESTGETWEDPGTMYEYDAINNYLTNLDTPNVIDAQGNATSILDRQKNINTTTPNPINNFLNTARNYLKQRGFRVGNKSMNSMTQVQQPNINPTNQPSPFLPESLRPVEQIPGPYTPPTYGPMTEEEAALQLRKIVPLETMPINSIFPEKITTPISPLPPLSEDATYLSPYERYLVNNYPKGLNNLQYDDSGEYTGFINSNNSKNSASPNSTTPWYKEPFYSKAARYSPLFASAAGVITGLQNKKRSLTPEDISPSKINLERSRITTAEEGRRGLDTALRTVRGGASSSGQLNAAARDLVLTGNKNIAANINKLYETEENTNAMNLYNSNLANQQYRNQFKITNEEMFQNAQKQALRAAQEGTQNLQGAAQDERAQYLQEWIAQNRLNTRSYKTNINGQDVYINPDGKVYDINGNPITV